ncbi:MAG: ABC transporter ATP-binding protein [Actinobacteria bacterium]|nr:ABC transporter ATP-binding protein [Actinomycetota bacterium]
MASALSFDHVSKSYRGAQEYRALRDDVMAGVARLARVRRPPRRVVNALDDISLDVPEGQSFALIGSNGAGKTTALKIASRIAYPTSGRVRVRGRVGALIEVGTGMHPELTGRENIQLFGRILGLSRRDVSRRFDDIVDFAAIGPAIDQPVKQFSSGMALRLGFALAAHLEPDVLLVDEAIAVGDAGFQYRCVERMSDLVREGRTLVFVSHDMSAVETLCERAVLLRDGRVALDGPARDVVHEYLLSVHASLVEQDTDGAVPGEDLEIASVALLDASGQEISEVPTGEAITIRVGYVAHRPIRRPQFSVGLTHGPAAPLSVASMLVDGRTPDVLAGAGHVDCTFEHLPLQPRTYEIWGEVRGEAGTGDLVTWQRLRRMRVTGDILGEGKSVVTHSLVYGPVRIPYHWTLPGEA